MAVTRHKVEDYTPSEEVQNYKNKLTETENSQPTGYTESDRVKNYRNKLTETENSKPADYNSKYTETLDSLLNQITNPEKFSYSFNGDELFKYYADLYSQKGKQASMDAQGQAAALTGGYGNSYGQQLGQQTYDQYMLDLYDKGLDLYDRAYNRYQDNMSNLYNQYNTVSSADSTDYNRYRDTVGDWKDMLDYYSGQYNTESTNDYNRYRDTVSDWQNMLDYYSGRADTTYSNDYNWYKDIITQEENEQDDAYDLATTMIENGIWPSEELLAAAGISPADAEALISANSTTSSGGSGGSGNGKLYSQGIDGNWYEVDEYGNLITNKDGSYNVVSDKDLPDNAGRVTNTPLETSSKIESYIRSDTSAKNVNWEYDTKTGKWVKKN